MSLDDDREFADRLIARLPANEEDLALWLGTTRDHIASICMTLAKARRIKLDTDWHAPRHWKRA